MKHEIKRKRWKILKQIDQWEKQRCHKCDNSQPYASAMKCTCTAAKEIRKLGEAYSAIATAVRKDRLDKLVASVEKEGLSVDGYRLLREEGMFDVDIRKVVKMSTNKFNVWKREEGIIDEKLEAHWKALKEWGPIAEQKGVPRSTFQNRVRKGESYESAATRPITQVPHNKKEAVK